MPSFDIDCRGFSTILQTAGARAPSPLAWRDNWYDGVAKKLHDHYYSDNFSGSTRKLIGSYGKGAAVRPPRDVDVLFLLPTTVYERYKDRSGNAQSQLLPEVRNVLLEKYSSTAIRGDGQVVVVPFANGPQYRAVARMAHDYQEVPCAQHARRRALADRRSRRRNRPGPDLRQGVADRPRGADH